MSGVLAGRVAIVAGGASRMGLAIGKGLAKEGARIVIADPDPAAVGAAAVELPGCAVYAGDVATEKAAGTIAGFAVERFGRLDIAVNTCAILRDGVARASPRADFEQAPESSLVAAHALTTAATAWMRESARREEGAKGGGNPERKPFGAIVNIISAADSCATSAQAVQVSSRAGLVGLTRATARDLARIGVTCNAVAVFASAQRAQAIVADGDSQAACGARELGIPAESVANLVTWLASPAGAAMTGQVFGVRGRELFLFLQGFPIARIDMPAGTFVATTYGEQFDSLLGPLYTALAADIEACDAETAL